jgi:hypothetical protein
MSDRLPTEIVPARASGMLTAAEFHRLADVPPEIEWFANLSNAGTRRVYENAVRDFPVTCPATQLRLPPCRTSAEPCGVSPASPSRSHLIPCAMRLQFICPRPALISVPSSSCLGIAVSTPQQNICVSPPAKCAPPLARWMSHRMSCSRQVTSQAI